MSFFKNKQEQIVESAFIHKGNLEIALIMAIEHRQEEEKELGFNSDSAMLAGWKQNLEILKKGKLYIKYEE